jgi:hypothetical protein
MSQISKALQALIDNPDDLSTLPQLISKVEALEKSEVDYQERIQKLQDINKNYLSQIPIASNEPTPPAEPEEVEVTFEEAQEQLLNAMKNIGGN